MMHSAMGSDEWKTINWKQVQKIVYRLQTRIFKAKRRGYQFKPGQYASEAFESAEMV